MGEYLLPEDDGLPMRFSGPWVKEKLFYVKQYIDTLEISMRGKPWRRRNFIDLFSGPGKCQIDTTHEVILGSPLLAITTKFPFTDCFFVDSEQENLVALKQRLSRKSSLMVNYSYGDANIKVQEIVDRISEIDSKFIKGAWPSLNLAFLDPEGLELEWDTVEKLAGLNRMDLIIHYSQHGINRMAANSISSNTDTIVDRFFGDRKWRQIYIDNRDKGIHLPLMNYYKERLISLGYVEIKDEEEIWTDAVRNRRNAPLYRLLFASKNSLGMKFWKHIKTTSLSGQGRLWSTI